jgi:hypothetical protein
MSASEPTTKVGAVRCRRTHVSVGSLLSSEVRSDAKGHMAASDPSWMAREGPEPLGMWQRRSPPRKKGGVWSLRHVAVLEPSLSREVVSGTAVACGSVWAHTLPFVLA